MWCVDIPVECRVEELGSGKYRDKRIVDNSPAVSKVRSIRKYQNNQLRGVHLIFEELKPGTGFEDNIRDVTGRFEYTVRHFLFY